MPEAARGSHTAPDNGVQRLGLDEREARSPALVQILHLIHALGQAFNGHSSVQAHSW